MLPRNRRRQPEVVCDLKVMLAGPIEGEGPQRVDDGDRIRLTFRNLDPNAGTGKVLFGNGASGEEFVAMTVDPNAITYLYECDRVSKMIVTTANRPGRSAGQRSCRSTGGATAGSQSGSRPASAALGRADPGSTVGQLADSRLTLGPMRTK